MPETKSLFNRVAKNYDFLNSVFSMGIDRLWRRRLIREIGATHSLLDIATGTAEVAIEALKKDGNSSAVGIDPSIGMLELAQLKLEALGLKERMSLVGGVAEKLPFRDETFDGVTISFGIRNTIDPLESLKEMRRVLKRGGSLGVLEFAIPTTPIFSPVYMFYLQNILPFIGSLFGTREEYDYLAESIPKFPQREGFRNLMEKAGFKPQKQIELTFGTVIIYVGVKEN